jgi:Aldo/keto reductases, related to diketogulonate reductase
VHAARIQENAQINDFELTAAEMQRMAALDEKQSLFGNAHDPEAVKQLGSFKFNY